MNDTTGSRVLAFLAGGLVFGTLAFLLGSNLGPDDGALTPGGTAEAGSPRPSRSSRRTPDEAPAAPVPTRPADAEQDETDDAERREMEAFWLKEKARRAAAAIAPDDTGLDVLAKIRDHGADLAPLYESFEAFSAPLRVAAPDEVVIDVTPENVNQVFGSFDESPSKVVFRLSPGDFTVERSLRLKNAAFVTLRGSGVDATVIRPRTTLLFAEGLDNLKVEDLTLDGRERSDGLLDSRGAAALLLSRCRFLGFDASGGHSAAIGVTDEAYIAAEDCAFLGGYGRGPWSGSALSLRAPAHAYLRNCTFRELAHFIIADAGGGNGSVVKLENCHSQFDLSDGRYGKAVQVTMSGCRWSDYIYDQHSAGPFIDLGGNVFEPIEPTAYRSLEAFLDALGDAWVTRVDVRRHASGHPCYVDVVSRGVLRTYFNEPGGAPRLRTETKGVGGGLHSPAISAARALGIAQASGETGSSQRTSPMNIVLRESWNGGELTLQWLVTRPDGRNLTIDAVTGAIH